jgi:hypothetical protein
MSAGPTPDYGECRAPQHLPGSGCATHQGLIAASLPAAGERIVTSSHARPDPVGYRAAMTNPAAGGSGEPGDEGDEDTIELMLSTEQMRLLSRAAAPESSAAGEAQSQTPPFLPRTAPTATTPAIASTAAGGPAAIDRGAAPNAAAVPARGWPTGRIAAILGVTGALGVLVALGILAQPAPARKQMAAIPNPAPVVPPPPVSEPPAPPGEPVRFKNPFDRSEVFEFPPGTSQAEARQAVAEMLMERARDRHVQLTDRKHTGVRRAAVRGSADLAQNSVRANR